jgi:hypothetical protein
MVGASGTSYVKSPQAQLPFGIVARSSIRDLNGSRFGKLRQRIDHELLSWTFRYNDDFDCSTPDNDGAPGFIRSTNLTVRSHHWS